jgi:hypothetical protein
VTTDQQAKLSRFVFQMIGSGFSRPTLVQARAQTSPKPTSGQSLVRKGFGNRNRVALKCSALPKRTGFANLRLLATISLTLHATGMKNEFWRRGTAKESGLPQRCSISHAYTDRVSCDRLIRALPEASSQLCIRQSLFRQNSTLAHRSSKHSWSVTV